MASFFKKMFIEYQLLKKKQISLFPLQHVLDVVSRNKSRDILNMYVYTHTLRRE